jgi:hypothetical protein|tara:strand:+ start:1377 stop:1823 length:447 start_codon:yes stop_codon:yes gene_type:complete
MIQDDLKLKGRLTVNLIAADGSIKNTQEIPNLVVTSGKTFVASRMAGTSSSVMSHMAIGTSSTAAAVGNSTLGAEVARVALTSATANNNDIVYVGSFPAATPSSSAAVVEAAIFNASSSGTMLCRTVFSVINKAATDSLSISWTISAS